jgi:osmoprotectant transport system substrate-binding protein
MSGRRIILWLLAVALCCVSCAGRQAGGRAIVVASGDSAQQRLLGALTVLALEADGFSVVHHTDLGDSARLRLALLSGSVDIMWDFTAVVWTDRLGHDQPIVSSEELYMRLRQEDQRNGIEWLSPAPFKSQVGLVMRADLASRLGLRTLDELATYARSRDAGVTLCTTQALSESSGGLPGLALVYGLSLAPWRIKITPPGDMLSALRKGECQAALSADAHSAAVERDLRILRDNRAFFHASDLAVAARRSALVEHAALEKRLRDLSGLVTQEAMVSMEREVVKGANPTRVARRYLNDVGFIGSSRPTPTPAPTPTVTPSL